MRVPFESLALGDAPGHQELIVTRRHKSGEMIEIPVACVTGHKPGPTFAVMSGMHAGRLEVSRISEIGGQPEERAGDEGGSGHSSGGHYRDGHLLPPQAL